MSPTMPETHGGGDQHQDHEVGELVEQHAQGDRRLPLAQHVGAVPLEALLRFGGTQPL